MSFKVVVALAAFFSIYLNPLYSKAEVLLDPKQKAKELFNQRQEKSKLEESIRLMEEFLSKEKDYELSVLLSRAYYFMAEYAEDNTQRLEIHDKGVKSGEMALNQVEAYTQALKNSGKEEDAVKAISNENLDALYWTAANLARWAKFAPFTKKIAAKPRVRYLWDRVSEIDANYFYGGVYRFFGGYYALVPTITGEQDPVKSKEMFEKALITAPQYLETKILYAEAYCTHAKIKDRELFQKLLNEVIQADLSANPEIFAENSIAKAKAEKLLKEEQELFE